MSETIEPRKRNNSLIPFEFRNDTRDGGIERAALATVFGVKEYTESKIFWNIEEQVETNSTPIVTRNFNSNTITKHSNLINKSLPLIPIVSQFDDFWSDTNNSTEERIDNNNKLMDYFNVTLPNDLSNLPLTLFDLIEADDDPNIILWSLLDNTINKEESKKKKSRWSTQLPNNLRKKFSVSNLIVEESTSTTTVTNHRIIEAATIEKLIEKLTITLDYTFMTDFFLIFRVFMTPLQLCKLLILRFKWSLEKSNENRCIVRIRTFVVMRHWLLNYFLHDFVPNKDLRIVYTDFLNEMPFHPTIKQSVRDQRIILGLKRVVQRLKKIYYDSSSSSRVKVIGPPPPTFHQQQVKALVQEKLSQHDSIRQRTLNIVNGIHLDTRHSVNTAIRDKHSAPVVVIGNYPSSIANRNSYSEANRRGSSNSSNTINHKRSHKTSLPNSLYNVGSDSGSKKEHSKSSVRHLKESDLNKSEDFNDASNILDNSIESILTPGTSDVDEEDILHRFAEDEDEDPVHLYIESPSEESIHSKSFIDSHSSQVSSDKLTEKLEKIRLQQQQDGDKTKPNRLFALDRQSSDLAIATALASIPAQETRPRSFYSAQLAIPSAIPTPDIIYPVSHPDQSETQVHPLMLSNSYQSMTYQSIADSDILTPSNPPHAIANPNILNLPRSRLSQQLQKDKNRISSTGSQKRSSKSSYHDPKTKPLPALSLHSSESNSSQYDFSSTYAKIKPLPEKSESWNLNGQSASSDFETKSIQEKSVKSTPKSRIMEIDINSNHKELLSSLPPGIFFPNQYESKSIILNYPTSLIAQQFCLIEKAILLDINWEELVDCKWTRMSTTNIYQPDLQEEEDIVHGLEIPDHIAQGIYSRTKRMKQQNEKNNENTERGVEKAINRFNAVCQWVSSEIVQTKQLQQRVKVIEKFIKLAKKCKVYCNFTTLIQILLGLQSSSVSRLEKTWSKVDKKVLKILHELSTFTSPTKNWKHIRDSMTQVADEFGESPTEIQVEVDHTKSKKLKSNSSFTIKLPFGGCIPFLGIYLSDLVFNAELPSFLPSSNQQHRGKINQNNVEAVLSQPLVHFRKHRLTATIIKRVLVFQNLAKRYSFIEAEDQLLYSTCLKVPSLDSDTIQKLSFEIEPVSSV